MRGMTLTDAITLATSRGYKVENTDHGFAIITPRPKSQELGYYRREASAWFDAALIVQLQT